MNLFAAFKTGHYFFNQVAGGRVETQVDQKLAKSGIQQLFFGNYSVGAKLAINRVTE